MHARTALRVIVAVGALTLASAGKSQPQAIREMEGAAPVFAATQTLSAKGFDAGQPGVAVDPAGRAVFVWTYGYSSFGGCSGDIIICSIQARLRQTDGSLSPVQTLSAGGDLHAFGASVGVDKSGNAVIAWMARDGKKQCEGGWSDCLRIQARRRSSSGALTAIQTLSPAGFSAYDPQVAVDSDGRAYMVWARAQSSCGGSCYRIEARVRSAAGALSAIETLSANGQQPRVAVTAAGKAVFSWIDNASGYVVKARARSASGGWGSVKTVSGVPGGFGAFVGDTYEHALAIDQQGNAASVWIGSDPAFICEGWPCRIVQARVLSAAGSLTPVQSISSPGEAHNPGVGAANGNALLIWYQQDNTLSCGGGQNGCFRARARTRSAGGSLGQVLTLSSPGQHATEPQVAVDGRGNALFVWQRQYPTVGSECGDGCLRIQSRSLSRANVLGSLQTLSAPSGAAGSPVVSVDPNGGLDQNAADAVAAWAHFDGSRSTCCFRIQDRADIAQ
jgi:hypothetical protein